MVPPTPSPSPRLVRAATAERAELHRHRERLLMRREALKAELAKLESALDELDMREGLLDRLAGPPAHLAPAGGDRLTRPAAAASGRPGGVPRPGAAGRAARDSRSTAGDTAIDQLPTGSVPADAGRADGGATVLRGPAIRRTAVRVMLALPDRPQALHYRAWFEALGAAGFAVAGKDPLAVFLTQLGRSPVVRRGTQSGVYEIDRRAPTRLHGRLEALQIELRGLTTAPAPTADLTAIRTHRAALTTQIGHVEKALEEALEVLSDSAAADVAAAG